MDDQQIDLFVSTVDDNNGLNSILREIPIAKVESALSIDDLLEAIARIFEKMAKSKTATLPSIARYVLHDNSSNR